MPLVRDGYLWDCGTRVAQAAHSHRDFLTDVFEAGEGPKSRCLVFAVSDVDGVVDYDLHGPSVVGVAVVDEVDGVAMGIVRAKFDPWLAIDPIPIAIVLSRAFGSEHSIELPQREKASRLTPGQSSRLMAVIGEHDARVARWLDEIVADNGPQADEQLQSKQEAQDAVRLASDIANVDLPSGAIRRRPAGGQPSLLDSVLSNAHQADLEEDLIPDELRRFDGLTAPEMRSSSVAFFDDGDFRLTVFNVNKRPVEIVLGVDLIYWDVTHDVFTLIQYKRLERLPVERGVRSIWAYVRRSEIVAQLDLMPTHSPTATHSRDWRMTQTPFWFKFVKGDAAVERDGKVLRGMYVPADYMRLAVDDGSLKTGPNGGFRVTYENTRHLDRDSFIKVIKAGLVGTVSVHSELMHDVIQDLTSRGRSVVLAVKSRWR